MGDTSWATKLQLCGRLAFVRDGQRLEARLPGKQGALLLGYLATNYDRSVTRDELVFALWGDEAPPDAAGAMAALLSKVRRVVGPELIDGRSTLRYAASDDDFIDVHFATEALHRAISGITKGDYHAAWQPAHTAYLIGSRRFMLGHEGEWIDDWRRKMSEVSMRGLECHARVTLEVSGRPSEAERVARQLVELAPFRETGYSMLMQALEQSGNRAEALLVFDRLRTLLAEELGTSPGPEVSEVHARLLGARA